MEKLLHHVILFNVCLWICLTTASDYCLQDDFVASCADEDEVVVMVTALYGRMSHSRCVSRLDGVCQTDVLSHLDQVCSGRTSCTYPVRQLVVDVTPPCRDLVSYLQATWKCVKVINPEGSCTPAGKLQQLSGLMTEDAAMPPPRYLLPPSSASFEHLELCPYQLSVSRNQQIVISLYDFNISATSRDTSRRNPPPLSSSSSSLASSLSSSSSGIGDLCLIILLDDADGSRDVTVCSNGERYRHIVTSAGETATIGFRKPPSPAKRFLFELSVIGCPLIHTPPATAVEYTILTNGKQTAKVTCNVSLETWYAECTDGKWSGTEYFGNCTESTSEFLPEIGPERTLYTLGVLAAVALGIIIGILIGLLLLVIFYRCSSKRLQDAYTGDALSREVDAGTPRAFPDIGLYQRVEGPPVQRGASLVRGGAPAGHVTCLIHGPGQGESPYDSSTLGGHCKHAHLFENPFNVNVKDAVPPCPPPPLSHVTFHPEDSRVLAAQQQQLQMRTKMKMGSFGGGAMTLSDYGYGTGRHCSSSMTSCDTFH